MNIDKQHIGTRRIRKEIVIRDREEAVRMVGEETVEQFDRAFDRNKSFFSRVKSFVKGENKLGRKVGAVLDVAMIFLPGGVRTGREAVQVILNKKQNVMPLLKGKVWYESKTMWVAIFTIVLGIFSSFGIDDPELMSVVLTVGGTLAGAFGLYAVRDAIGDVKEDLKKQSESKTE